MKNLKQIGETQDKTVNFIIKSLVCLCKLDQTSNLKILDFGCGKGNLVKALTERGYDSYGCDIKEHWVDNSKLDHTRFKIIPLSPYKLPYPDDYFDAVVSITVV
ncbi:MAG TPA: hypothetical protein DCF68_22805 [Cyanothece sp. UBA12306]|nr:hypothetical protein [Cyanothece sp. UBA12306]